MTAANYKNKNNNFNNNNFNKKKDNKDKKNAAPVHLKKVKGEKVKKGSWINVPEREMPLLLSQIAATYAADSVPSFKSSFYSVYTADNNSKYVSTSLSTCIINYILGDLSDFSDRLYCSTSTYTRETIQDSPIVDPSNEITTSISSSLEALHSLISSCPCDASAVSSVFQAISNLILCHDYNLARPRKRIPHHRIVVTTRILDLYYRILHDCVLRLVSPDGSLSLATSIVNANAKFSLDDSLSTANTNTTANDTTSSPATSNAKSWAIVSLRLFATGQAHASVARACRGYTRSVHALLHHPHATTTATTAAADVVAPGTGITQNHGSVTDPFRLLAALGEGDQDRFYGGRVEHHDMQERTGRPEELPGKQKDLLAKEELPGKQEELPGKEEELPGKEEEHAKEELLAKEEQHAINVSGNASAGKHAAENAPLSEKEEHVAENAPLAGEKEHLAENDPLADADTRVLSTPMKRNGSYQSSNVSKRPRVETQNPLAASELHRQKASEDSDDDDDDVFTRIIID
ncbi:MAG: hypothetical protein SGCHY_000255 [Lobulomycetales sp.]